jgi:molecular chaperone DnaK
MANDNKSLGKFRLTGIPPAPMGIPQIEVTFDIDANGIVNVTAKDRATNKEQAMTITGGTALARDDIDRMMRDAEAYAEEDAARRELVETRNQADQLVYQTETLLKEQEEQLTDEERDSITAAMGELKTELEGPEATMESIRSRMDATITASQALAQRLYAQAAQEQADAGGEPGAEDADDDEIVDAEIVDDEA